MIDLPSRIDAFAEQAKKIAREAIAERDMAVSNFHKAVDNIAQLQADKAELLEALRYYADPSPHAMEGGAGHEIAEAAITKHSGAGETG